MKDLTWKIIQPPPWFISGSVPVCGFNSIKYLWEYLSNALAKSAMVITIIIIIKVAIIFHWKSLVTLFKTMKAAKFCLAKLSKFMTCTMIELYGITVSYGISKLQGMYRISLRKLYEPSLILINDACKKALVVKKFGE